MNGYEHKHAQVALDYTKAFGFGIALNLLYIGLEVGFGLASDSMALLADAGHNASDVLSLLLAWAGSYLNHSTRTRFRTYGLRRTSILASLANAILLLLAVGAIAWEAVHRFNTPRAIPGITIMWVAGVGVIINAATALLFARGRHNDLNVRGAFLHMAADAGVSAGVVIAGLAIHLTGRLWIDPAASLVIVTVVAVATWGLLSDSVNLALDAVPKGIDPDQVEEYLGRLPGISAVHDMHIWALSTTQSALTAHLVKLDGEIDDSLIGEASRELRERFGIEHITLQFERTKNCVQDSRQPI